MGPLSIRHQLFRRRIFLHGQRARQWRLSIINSLANLSVEPLVGADSGSILLLADVNLWIWRRHGPRHAWRGWHLGSTIPGMGTSYVPNQSIYASVGPRYSNATALQLTYATSPRGSITASGSYGLLNFVDPGNVDNDTTTATVGYNYALSRENSIGAFYRFSSYHYPGQPQAFGNQSFNIAFSRKLTGRMALQLYGGPVITTFRVPVGGQSNKIGANAGATVTYAFKDGELNWPLYPWPHRWQWRLYGFEPRPGEFCCQPQTIPYVEWAVQLWLCTQYISGESAHELYRSDLPKLQQLVFRRRRQPSSRQERQACDCL